MALALPVVFYKKSYVIQRDDYKFHDKDAYYLDKAYKSKEKYYLIKDGTMYIAGSCIMNAFKKQKTSWLGVFCLSFLNVF